MVNRTLCPIDNHPTLLQDRQSDVYISVSTSSLQSVEFQVLLHRQEIFQVTKIDETYTATVSPSSPIYFQINLPLEVDSALIKFESDDEVCSIMSVQNITCPVYDLDLNIKFEGEYIIYKIMDIFRIFGTLRRIIDRISGIFLIRITDSKYFRIFRYFLG